MLLPLLPPLKGEVAKIDNFNCQFLTEGSGTANIYAASQEIKNLLIYSCKYKKQRATQNTLLYYLLNGTVEVLFQFLVISFLLLLENPKCCQSRCKQHYSACYRYEYNPKLFHLKYLLKRSFNLTTIIHFLQKKVNTLK